MSDPNPFDALRDQDSDSDSEHSELSNIPQSMTIPIPQDMLDRINNMPIVPPSIYIPSSVYPVVLPAAPTTGFLPTIPGGPDFNSLISDDAQGKMPTMAELTALATSGGIQDKLMNYDYDYSDSVSKLRALSAAKIQRSWRNRKDLRNTRSLENHIPRDLASIVVSFISSRSDLHVCKIGNNSGSFGNFGHMPMFLGAMMEKAVRNKEEFKSKCSTDGKCDTQKVMNNMESMFPTRDEIIEYMERNQQYAEGDMMQNMFDVMKKSISNVKVKRQRTK